MTVILGGVSLRICVGRDIGYGIFQVINDSLIYLFGIGLLAVLADRFKEQRDIAPQAHHIEIEKRADSTTLAHIQLAL